MPQIRLYCPDLQTGTVVLSPDESHHAANVRRATVGDRVTLFDGRGREADGEIAGIVRGAMSVRIERIAARPFDCDLRVTLAVATGKAHRQAYLIEKCTELGAAAIWPITGARSVTRPGETAVRKWRRRAVEAAKQSGRAWVPDIAAPQTFASAIARTEDFDASCITDTRTPLPSFSDFLAEHQLAISVLVFVGPEGGWHDAELSQAAGLGIVGVSLAPTILRTETAAAAVCAAAAMKSASSPAESD